MVKVKVCGITRFEDAQLAVKCGAWALGFIFYPKSARYVGPEIVADILARLRDEHLLPEWTVGVFVNADSKTIRQMQKTSGINTIQLHGDEPAEFLSELSDLRLIKAFRLASPEQFKLLPAYEKHVDAFLFDAAVDGTYGGTGHSFNWEWLASLQSSKPVILSGGLRPDNVLSATEKTHPFALDLSSGVEVKPGIKDPSKLAELFRILGVSHATGS